MLLCWIIPALHMKKVKELTSQYSAAGKSTDAAVLILREIVGEIPELVRARNAQRSDAMLAILNQGDDRWIAFVNQAKIPEFRYAFRSWQLKFSPEVYFIWIQTFPGRELPHPSVLGHSQTDTGL